MFFSSETETSLVYWQTIHDNSFVELHWTDFDNWYLVEGRRASKLHDWVVTSQKITRGNRFHEWGWKYRYDYNIHTYDYVQYKLPSRFLKRA